MNHQAPRLLFIARSFPPVANIATIRMASMARQLQRCGWQVTVLAPDPGLLREPGNPARLQALLAEGVRVIHTGYGMRALVPGLLRQPSDPVSRLAGAGLRRLARLLDLDDGTGWVGPLIQAAGSLEPGEVDLVLASGSPFASFRAARLLADHLKCPFVLDYRDPWTLRDFRAVPVRPWTRREERSLNDRAAAVLHVSPMLVEAHVEAFGNRERNHGLTNGYDPDELDPVVPARFDHRAIVYAGRFYPPHRVIDPVLAALARLVASDPVHYGDVRFHYYGADGAHVIRAAEACGARELVVDHARVPQEQSFAASKGAAVTVVVTSVEHRPDRGVLGNLPGKLFEAIGLGSPLLVVAPEGSQARGILDHCGGGIGCSGHDPEGLAAALRTLLDGAFPPRLPAAGDYAWPALVTRLDAILRPLAGGAGGVR